MVQQLDVIVYKTASIYEDLGGSFSKHAHTAIRVQLDHTAPEKQTKQEKDILNG